MKLSTLVPPRSIASALLCLLFAASSMAQGYPGRAITIVVPSAAGSPSDMIGRIVGQSMATQLKGAVVVDDKVGASGIIGVQAVVNAPADGHTLLFTTLSPIGLNKYLIKSLPYDAEKDLVPVGVLARVTHVLAVNPKLPFKSVQELVAYARQNPGKLNFGYGTAVPQLAASMLQQLTGVKVTLVPYKAHTAMVTALVGGEIDATIADTGSLTPFVKSGQLRALAVTSPERIALYPDTPTLRESGVGYELVAWHGLFVKRGTSPEIISRLTDVLKVAHRSAEMQSYLTSSAFDNFFVTGTEAASYVQMDIQRWGQITRDAGIVPN